MYHRVSILVLAGMSVCLPAKANAVYVVYFGALVDEKGWLEEACSSDGLHPNADGYKVMAPLVEAGIRKALK